MGLLVLFYGCKKGDESLIHYRFEKHAIYFEHSNIHLLINDHMYMEVSYFDGSRHISITHDEKNSGEVIPPHFIELNGLEYKDFELRDRQMMNIDVPQFGKGIRLILTGIHGGVEKTMFIEMYETYPDVAVSWCSYKNLTDTTLYIDHVYYNYYRLDRKLTNPEAESYSFHYLQPLNKAWGETWTNLEVGPAIDEDFIIPGTGSNYSGIPFLDVWGAELGMAIFHVEGIPRLLHILLKAREDHKLDMGFKTKPTDTFSQFPDRILPGESITTWKSAVCLHKGDFFNGASRFGEFLDGALKKVGRKGLIRNYPEQAYEPYWKTWGMNSLDGTQYFTLEQVRNKMNELADDGFKAIMLDAGWNKDKGLWDLDPDKFSSERKMIDFVKEAHTPQWGSSKNHSFKVYLWFDLLGVDTLNSITFPFLVKNEEGSLYNSIQSLYAFCPSFPGTIQYIHDSLIDRIINKWDVDGLYSDLEDQNPLPCYAMAHNHPFIFENVESNYLAFQRLFDGIMTLKPTTGWISQCACASVHDVYQYPYYFFEDASDPVNNKQVRWRVRWIKAVRGPTAPAGDGYVDKMNYDQKAGEPAQSVAIGSVITSVRWNVEELGGAEHVKKWMDLYFSEGLSSGEYLGLYDIAYEKPEGYVIRKEDGSFYYAFIDEQPFDENIELRGLTPYVRYQMFDYENDVERGEVYGHEAYIHITSTPGNDQGQRIYYAVLKCVPE
jgi:alpha-galactosidase